MQKETLQNEIIFKAIRSSGAGGQHVNKVSSKVVLIFNLTNSKAFNIDEKVRLTAYLGTKLSKEGVLQLASDESRSQFQNKRIVTERFMVLIKAGLIVKRPRKKTRPSRSTILKAKAAKIRNSKTKALRKKPGLE